MDDDGQNANDHIAPAADENVFPCFSKSLRKKLLKHRRLLMRKEERKAKERDRKRQDLERRRREWAERIAAAPEEERARLIESGREVKRERIGRQTEERAASASRLRKAAEAGQKVVLDLEFADLMTDSEIHSLVQQIVYCYAGNRRAASPAHLWLTGCREEIEHQLLHLPGFDNWIIEKEDRSYVEALHDHKEDLVYLTADAENVLDELDPKKIYIIGGLVDRNRWKGITLNKANDQAIQSAKLPIANYLKMSSSQVLTVNQVFEILLKFLETRDWKSAFFQVIPQRKRGEVESGTAEGEEDQAVQEAAERDIEGRETGVYEEEEDDGGLPKKLRIREAEGEEAEDKESEDVEGGGMHKNQPVSEANNDGSDETN